ncbi:MAG: transcriptional regulator [Candidatus Lokiarchaeota archaeon]
MLKREDDYNLPDEAKNLIIPKNSIFSSTIRFTIMMILNTHKKAKFTEFQKLLHLTSGNLNHHLQKLIDKGFVLKKQGIFPRRVLTYVTITKKGEQKFLLYINKIQEILNKAGSSN